MSKTRYAKKLPDFVIMNINSLETIRKNLHWTRAYVARATGVSATTLMDYENGNQYPYKRSYNKLAKFFDWEEWQ